VTEYTLKFNKPIAVEAVVRDRKCEITSTCVHMVDDKPYMAGTIRFAGVSGAHAYFTPLRQAEFLEIKKLSPKEQQSLFDKEFVQIRIDARLNDLTISAHDKFKDIFGAIRKVRAAMDRAIMEAIKPTEPKGPAVKHTPNEQASQPLPTH